jgi:hypothetical protein
VSASRDHTQLLRDFEALLFSCGPYQWAFDRQSKQKALALSYALLVAVATTCSFTLGVVCVAIFRVCPYSHATRGNVDVAFDVIGG